MPTRRPRSSIPLMALALGLTHPGSPPLAWGDAAPSAEATLPAPATDVAALKAKALELRGARLDPAKARAAIDALAAWGEAAPEDPRPATLEAQTILFYVSYLKAAKDDAEREALFAQGLAHTRAASARHPGDVGSDFWGAIMLANHSREKGIMSSLSNYGEMSERMDRAQAKEPAHYYGGIPRFWGRVIDQIPGSLRAVRGYDLDDSVAYFEASIAMEPRFLLTYYYLGDTYLKMGEREKALAALKKATEGDPRALPEAYPENVINQRRAASLIAREFPD